MLADAETWLLVTQTILMPLVLLGIGYFLNRSLQSQGISQSYVDRAAEILKDKDVKNENPELYKWALRVFTRYSPEPLSEKIIESVARSIRFGDAALLLEVIEIDRKVSVGNSNTFVLTLTNQGRGAARDCVVSADLSSSLLIKSVSGATNKASQTENCVVFKSLPALHAKAKASWQIVVEPQAKGKHYVRAKVIAAPPEPAFDNADFFAV